MQTQMLLVNQLQPTRIEHTHISGTKFIGDPQCRISSNNIDHIYLASTKN